VAVNLTIGTIDRVLVGITPESGRRGRSVRRSLCRLQLNIRRYTNVSLRRITKRDLLTFFSSPAAWSNVNQSA
jgi:hypothetical protein